MMDHPARITVIIPTHNRASSLRQTLDALGRQTALTAIQEVIVVLDGCTDNTDDMLSNYDPPYRLELLTLPGLGAGAARNRGAAHAQSDLLLFIDDDVAPEPELVAGHLRSHQAASNGVVIGPYPTAAEGNVSFLHIMTRLYWSDKFAEMESDGHRFSYRDIVSGNLSIGRELYLELGGFDEIIRSAGGEDYEFGLRLVKAGVDIHFAKDALAYHHDHATTNNLRSILRARQEGRADVYMGGKHREIRMTLGYSYFHEANSQMLRFLLWLVFDHPGFGDRLMYALFRLLDPLEKMTVRRRWQELFGLLRAYWYWRGVGDLLPSRNQLTVFMQSGPLPVDDPSQDLEIDLACGLAAAEEELNRCRPPSARIRYGDYIIARMPQMTAHEPLRGRHLRPFLAANLLWPLAQAMSIENLIGVNGQHDLSLSPAIMGDPVLGKEIYHVAKSN